MMVQRNPLAALGAVLVVAAMVSGGMGRLEERALDSKATCNAQSPNAIGGSWLWMDNKQKKSPCLAAAYAFGPCVSESYVVPALGPTDKYSPPAGSNVTACACSWAVYNLLSACSLCQDRQNSITTWFAWTTNCGNFTSTDKPYPDTATMDNTSIPYWAGINPTTWMDGRWNGQQAYQEAVQHPGDILLPTPSPVPITPKSNSGNNIGAIAGGVVGGVAAIAAGVAIALFIFCRNKRRREAKQTQMTEAMGASPFDPHHARSPSDLSTKTYGSNLGYAPLGHASSPSSGSTNRFPYSPTTFRTHNSSRGSFAQESLLAPTMYPTTPPPQAVAAPPNVYMTPHGAVSPFTLDRPSTPQEASSAQDRDSKRAISPTQPGEAAAAPGRAPMNPPAYSEAPHGRGDFSSQSGDHVSTYGSASIMTTPNAQSRRPHEKSPSVGSMSSESSTTSAGFWTHATSTSLSGAADLLSQMDSSNAPGPSSISPSIPPYTGPGPMMTVQHTRDEKRRPTIMNPENEGENVEHHQ